MSSAGASQETARLRAELAQLKLLANNLPVAIAYYERAGTTCRYANAVYAGLFGFTETSILGRRFSDVIGAEAALEIQPWVDAVLAGHGGSRYERRLPDGQGGWRSIEVDLLPHHGDVLAEPSAEAAQPGPVGVFVLVNDITRHRQAEQALRDSEERLAKFMHASAEGIVFHRDGLITDANPPLLDLVGHTLDDMLGRPTLDFVPADQRERVRAVIVSGAEIAYESAVLHRDGTRIPVEFIVRTMRHADTRLRMTIVRDLRDRVEARSRIAYLAHHDELTGLPNRSAFQERAEALLSLCRSERATAALMFIDLDHFKRINDSLGHLAGDELLKTVAQRIGGALRKGDLVSRFGGDEFLVLLGGGPPREVVAQLAEQLLAAVAAPVEVDGEWMSVTPSIGVALYPEHGRSPDELVKHADTAMYSAKADGRAAWRWFEPEMAETAYAELALETQLVQAIRDQAFELHFQPQLRLCDGALCGFEALIRWAHPDLGLLGPNAFIPVAESRRLMLPIGQWALREALRQAARWRAQGLTDVPVAVNLSSLQFQAADFVPSVQALLQETGMPGSALELELTERMLMDDLRSVQALLQQLRGLGVAVSVDDFGTGYTSLARLKNLAVDRLKIDRSFVHDLPDNTGSAAIARAIIQMAHSLGLRTVAEGVETEAQRRWMHEQGCDEVQGHLAGRPMPAEAVEVWLRQRQALAAG
ncbi:MAG: putative bifunctional diguanylate cyclase/phosphodiesterase [Rubrivivax sp.]